MRWITGWMLGMLLASGAWGGNLIDNADFRKGTSGVRISGRAEATSDADRRAGAGDLLIRNGRIGFRVMWRQSESGMYRCRVRFRKADEWSGIGLAVTVNDRTGAVAEIPGVAERTGEDVVFTARVPVSPEVTSLWISLSGRSDGRPAALDRLALERMEDVCGEPVPPTPEVTGTESPRPFQVEVRFRNYQYGSRGAVLERSVDGGAFAVVAETAPYAHCAVDPAAVPGSRSRYRVRLRSAAGISPASAAGELTVPAWSRSPGGRVWYVDAAAGGDANRGDAPESAWKTLERASRQVYAPGDRLLFRCGGVWSGALDLHGSGTAAAPIRVGVYGEGARPRIDGRGHFAVRLRNESHWEIAGLELTNRQPVPAERLKAGDRFTPAYIRGEARVGLLLELDNYGEAENIVVRDLEIHDVEGRQQVKENGGLLVLIDGHRKASRYRNLVIERNLLRNVCRSGIVFRVFPHVWRTDWYPSLGVKIAGNRLFDIGGDGIVPWACDGAEVSGNEVWRAAATGKEPNVAIWPWSCDNTRITGNLAADTAKHGNNYDGQGYDIDTNNFNTVVENNLSFRNAGGFMLIIGEQTPLLDLTCRRAIVRNNLSIADGSGSGAVFTLLRALDDVWIYNNTVWVSPASATTALIADWGKDRRPDQMTKIRFFNNLVVSERELEIRGMHGSWSIHHNRYWGRGAAGLARVGTENRVADPGFSGTVDPAGDIPGQLEKLRPRDASGAVALNPEYTLRTDYFGRPVRPGAWVGAIEPVRSGK